MIMFWIAAALLSAGAGALVIRGAVAPRSPTGENAALAVHRRQLAEIDDLAERGLLADGERKAARAEAGRRLLNAVDDAARPVQVGSDARPILLALAAGAPLLAAVLYATVAGAPGKADQPFAARVEAWKSHPDDLDWSQKLAIASLETQRHPGDVPALKQLAIANLFVGDAPSAEAAARRILLAAPNDPEGYTLLAAAFARESAAVTPAVKQALARAQALVEALPADDPSRERVAGQTQGVYSMAAEAAGAAQGPMQQAQAGGGGMTPDMIRTMVDRLAARLKGNPDDAQGWVMLVRAYGVIGEFGKRDAALAEARARYAGRADILTALDKAKEGGQ
jgi:cytochrome c-type biogenesis protein CcmH